MSRQKLKASMEFAYSLSLAFLLLATVFKLQNSNFIFENYHIDYHLCWPQSLFSKANGKSYWVFIEGTRVLLTYC